MVSRTLMMGVVAAIIIIIAGAGIYIAMQPAQPPSTKLKVAVFLPGSITDAGWNSAAYIAANAIGRKMNDTVEMTVVEGLGQVGVEPTMRDFASRGYSLIFGWTNLYQSPALNVAPSFPDTYFIVPSLYNFSLRNVLGAVTPQWEGAYLAGMVAAGVTNTSKIGAVAGYNYAETAAVAYAFFDGAKKVNPNIKGTVIFAGVWDDVGKGREAGEALIDQGCDVLIGRGDGLTLGVVQAASIHSAPGTSKTVYMIGDVADQHALAPKTIITSNLLDNQPIFENFMALYKNGTLATNSNNGIRKYSWGLSQGVSDISPFYGLDYKVPQTIKAMIIRCRSAIIAGTFSMSVNYTDGSLIYKGTF